jgi:hypothetical protein
MVPALTFSMETFGIQDTLTQGFRLFSEKKGQGKNARRNIIFVFHG